jgi:Family of unknown function (DUF5338)
MPRQINGRVSFLALMDEIRRELNAGHFARTVHARYEQRLAMSYRQFLRYVREYGLLAEARPHLASPVTRPLAPLTQPAVVPAEQQPISTQPPQPKRFIFEPAKIDEKKLI